MPLPLGQRVEVKLLSMASVDFDVAPEGTAPGREGGLLMLVVPAPGRYRVMLGGPAWIDLVAAGKPLASVGHDHGPACSGIRKMVDFQLAAGRYTLQLSGAQTATIAVMVVPVVNEGNQ
ncbi:homogentisate 1,2-dioxygenase [Sphingomonas sp.]|uniref:homogentisate 1,2-dioxygenase n=1 Tax=Sphingomonas sp. TaxID=28214 RepID=UPI0025F8BCCE|nr:homogentisate 1,2-dioxygenase [Sphingomonas sp.]